MNTQERQEYAQNIIYSHMKGIQTDIKTLVDMKLLHKNIERRPLMVGYYDKTDAGNRSYIHGQETLAKILDIPYTALDVNQLPEAQELTKMIQNQNDITHIGSIFVANPVHKDLEFQRTIDTVAPIKEIDGLSTFHKSKYIGALVDNLEGVYFHPTALSVVSFLQGTLNKDLTNKKILVAGGSGKVGSMICALLKLNGAIPEIYNITPDTYNPEELEDHLTRNDGFVCVIRGAEVFDGGLFNNFKGPIIDVSTAKNIENKTVGGVKTISLDPKADNIYIPPIKNGVGTLTKTHLMGNYIRSIATQITQNGKDTKYLQNIVHKPDNSDIIQGVTAN